MVATPQHATKSDRPSWSQGETQQIPDDATDNASANLSVNTLAGFLVDSTSQVYSVVDPPRKLNSPKTTALIRRQKAEHTAAIHALNQFIFQAGNIYKGKELNKKDEERLREAANHVGLSMDVVDALLEQTADSNAVVKYCMASDDAFARKMKKDPQLSRLLDEGSHPNDEGSFDLADSVWRVFMHKIVHQFLKEHAMELGDVMNKLTSQLYEEALRNDRKKSEYDNRYTELANSPAELARIRRDYTQERKQVSIPLDEAKKARQEAEARTHFEPHRPFHHLIHGEKESFIIGDPIEARDDELSTRACAKGSDEQSEARHPEASPHDEIVSTPWGGKITKRKSGASFATPRKKMQDVMSPVYREEGDSGEDTAEQPVSAVKRGLAMFEKATAQKRGSIPKSQNRTSRSNIQRSDFSSARALFQEISDAERLMPPDRRKGIPPPPASTSTSKRLEVPQSTEATFRHDEETSNGHESLGCKSNEHPSDEERHVKSTEEVEGLATLDERRRRMNRSASNSNISKMKAPSRLAALDSFENGVDASDNSFLGRKSTGQTPKKLNPNESRPLETDGTASDSVQLEEGMRPDNSPEDGELGRRFPLASNARSASQNSEGPKKGAISEGESKPIRPSRPLRRSVGNSDLSSLRRYSHAQTAAVEDAEVRQTSSEESIGASDGERVLPPDGRKSIPPRPESTSTLKRLEMPQSTESTSRQYEETSNSHESTTRAFGCKSNEHPSDEERNIKSSEKVEGLATLDERRRRMNRSASNSSISKMKAPSRLAALDSFKNGVDASDNSFLGRKSTGRIPKKLNPNESRLFEKDGTANDSVQLQEGMWPDNNPEDGKLVRRLPLGSNVRSAMQKLEGPKKGAISEGESKPIRPLRRSVGNSDLSSPRRCSQAQTAAVEDAEVLLQTSSEESIGAVGNQVFLPTRPDIISMQSDNDEVNAVYSALTQSSDSSDNGHFLRGRPKRQSASKSQRNSEPRSTELRQDALQHRDGKQGLQKAREVVSRDPVGQQRWDAFHAGSSGFSQHPKRRSSEDEGAEFAPFFYEKKDTSMGQEREKAVHGRLEVTPHSTSRVSKMSPDFDKPAKENRRWSNSPSDDIHGWDGKNRGASDCDKIPQKFPGVKPYPSVKSYPGVQEFGSVLSPNAPAAATSATSYSEELANTKEQSSDYRSALKEIVVQGETGATGPDRRNRFTSSDESAFPSDENTQRDINSTGNSLKNTIVERNSGGWVEFENNFVKASETNLNAGQGRRGLAESENDSSRQTRNEGATSTDHSNDAPPFVKASGALFKKLDSKSGQRSRESNSKRPGAKKEAPVSIDRADSWNKQARALLNEDDQLKGANLSGSEKSNAQYWNPDDKNKRKSRSEMSSTAQGKQNSNIPSHSETRASFSNDFFRDQPGSAEFFEVKVTSQGRPNTQTGPAKQAHDDQYRKVVLDGRDPNAGDASHNSPSNYAEAGLPKRIEISQTESHSELSTISADEINVRDDGPKERDGSNLSCHARTLGKEYGMVSKQGKGTHQLPGASYGNVVEARFSQVQGRIQNWDLPKEFSPSVYKVSQNPFRSTNMPPTHPTTGKQSSLGMKTNAHQQVGDYRSIKRQKTDEYSQSRSSSQESDFSALNTLNTNALNPLHTETTRSMSSESDFDAFNVYEDSDVHRIQTKAPPERSRHAPNNGGFLRSSARDTRTGYGNTQTQQQVLRTAQNQKHRATRQHSSSSDHTFTSNLYGSEEYDPSSHDITRSSGTRGTDSQTAFDPDSTLTSSERNALTFSDFNALRDYRQRATKDDPSQANADIYAMNVFPNPCIVNGRPFIETSYKPMNGGSPTLTPVQPEQPNNEWMGFETGNTKWEDVEGGKRGESAETEFEALNAFLDEYHYNGEQQLRGNTAPPHTPSGFQHHGLSGAPPPPPPPPPPPAQSGQGYHGSLEVNKSSSTLSGIVQVETVSRDEGQGYEGHPADTPGAGFEHFDGSGGTLNPTGLSADPNYSVPDVNSDLDTRDKYLESEPAFVEQQELTSPTQLRSKESESTVNEAEVREAARRSGIPSDVIDAFVEQQELTSPTQLRSKDSESTVDEAEVREAARRSGIPSDVVDVILGQAHRVKRAPLKGEGPVAFDHHGSIDSDTCQPASARYLRKEAGPTPSGEQPATKLKSFDTIEGEDKCNFEAQTNLLTKFAAIPCARKDPSPTARRSVSPSNRRASVGSIPELPEGASEEELKLLNRFIEVAASNFDGKKLSADSESRVRAAALKVGLSEKFVDQLLEQARANNEKDAANAPVSTVGVPHSPVTRGDGSGYYTVDLTRATKRTRKTATDRTEVGCQAWENITNTLKSWANCGGGGGGGDDGSSISSAPSVEWKEGQRTPGTPGTPGDRSKIRALV